MSWCSVLLVLVAMAIGDAYGAGFEYAPPDAGRPNTVQTFVQHPRLRIAPGHYTDDTQMALAITELLLEDGEWTSLRIAEKFVEVFKRDPREGYARGFYRLLCEVMSGADLLARVRPSSDKSGAAMRAPPIGVLADVDEIVDRCVRQANVTHDTEGGRASAIAAALMTHFHLYRRGPAAELPFFVERYVAGPWRTPFRGSVGPLGISAVHAAIHALSTSRSMRQLLKTCVDFGGDVDTVAAIALAAGSCARELVQDLPTSLVDGIENGAFGRDYLRGVERRLLEKRAPSATLTEGLLAGSSWSVEKQGYDFLQCVRFDDDGFGEFVSGSGQLLRHEVRFRYRLLGMEIEFAPLSALDAFRVGFILLSGPFEIERPYEGRIRFEYALLFQHEPFEGEVSDRTYYGGPR